MTATNSNGAHSVTPTDLISLSEACSILGCSPSSIRSWASQGLFKCYRFAGGWRRFSKREIKAFAYGEDERENNLVVAYCRTSTQKQKESLARQEQRVLDYCRENYPEQKTILISDNASGMNFFRQGLVKLVKMLVNNELNGGKIVCEFKDRLTRVAAPMLELIAEQKNVEIVYIEQQDKTDEEMLQEDIMSILHIFNCKNYSRRGADKLRKRPAKEIIVEGKKQLGLGLSYQQLVDYFSSKGVSLTRHQIAKYIADPAPKLVETAPATITKTSVQLFHELATVKPSTHRTIIADAYRAYLSFCQKKNLVALSQKRFSMTFRYPVGSLMVGSKVVKAYKGLEIAGVACRVVNELEAKPAMESASDAFQRFLEREKGYAGRLSEFHKKYSQWAMTEKVELLPKTRAKANLIQAGGNIRMRDGIKMLAL